jgi:hypothetical protein
MKFFHKLILITAAAISLVSCGNDQTIDNKHYQTFGVANQDAYRDPNIVYEISAGSVIWGIILCETIVVPVYIIGWDLWQPVRKVTPISKETS